MAWPWLWLYGFINTPLSLSHWPDRSGLSIDFVSFVSRNHCISYLGVVDTVLRPILGNLSISSSPPQFESGCAD